MSSAEGPLGVVNMAVGLWELIAMLMARHTQPPASPFQPIHED